MPPLDIGFLILIELLQRLVSRHLLAMRGDDYHHDRLLMLFCRRWRPRHRPAETIDADDGAPLLVQHVAAEARRLAGSSVLPEGMKRFPCQAA